MAPAPANSIIFIYKTPDNYGSDLPLLLHDALHLRPSSTTSLRPLRIRQPLSTSSLAAATSFPAVATVVVAEPEKLSEDRDLTRDVHHMQGLNFIPFLISIHRQTHQHRQAFVIARSKRQTHEIYVAKPTRSSPTFVEHMMTSALPVSYTPLLDSVHKRRLKIRDVICLSFSVGWFGEVKQRRVLKMSCFASGNTANMYVKPSFGPQGKPVTVFQPEGNGFKIEGYNVKQKHLCRNWSESEMSHSMVN